MSSYGRSGGYGGSRDDQQYGKAPRYRPATGRPTPYDPERDKPQGVTDEDGMFETPPNSFKVGSGTSVQELAHTIVQSCHAGELPTLLTIGPASINQAVKGIAAAAVDLKQTGDLTFQPAFRHTNRTKPLIAFYLARHRITDRMDEGGEEFELTATNNQKIMLLAGAIAGKVRETRRLHVLAIGADAVTNAVLAIGNARLFLEADQLDVKVAPEFVKITKNGQQISAVRLNIIPERI